MRSEKQTGLRGNTSVDGLLRMEQAKGTEPSYAAWEAGHPRRAMHPDQTREGRAMYLSLGLKAVQTLETAIGHSRREMHNGGPTHTHTTSLKQHSDKAA